MVFNAAFGTNTEFIVARETVWQKILIIWPFTEEFANHAHDFLANAVIKTLKIEREGIYVYLYLIRVVVQQKRTQ